MSTATSTPATSTPPTTTALVGGPTPGAPRLDPAIDATVDAVLRLLWQFVGVYVWLVLLAKRDRPAPGSFWGRPRDLNP